MRLCTLKKILTFYKIIRLQFGYNLFIIRIRSSPPLTYSSLCCVFLQNLQFYSTLDYIMSSLPLYYIHYSFTLPSSIPAVPILLPISPPLLAIIVVSVHVLFVDNDDDDDELPICDTSSDVDIKVCVSRLQTI